jgi:hypothetical protein
VIPRIGSQITYYGTAALRQFEMLGSYPAQRIRRHFPRPR